MKSMKVLRSACMLAVACSVVATVDAVAQTRDKPAPSQVRKASAPKAAKQAQRKPSQTRHGQHAQHGKKKSRPIAADKSKQRKPVAGAKTKSATRSAANHTPKKPSATTVARQPARTLPPPLVWVPPPLGPERFYPNGIPELRPEFMHPEGAPARVEQAVNTRPEPLGGQPEMLP